MVADLVELMFPRTCPVCGRRLLPSEQCLCLECQLRLPRVRLDQENNEAENRMFGRIPFEHGASFCYYSPKGSTAQIIQKAKFGGMPWLDSQLTHLFAQELSHMGTSIGEGLTSCWPFDIDCIVPIPIHWRRRFSRGYNQSSAIAEALSALWHLPVIYDCLVKHLYTTSQVGLRRDERMRHVEGSFSVAHPEKLQGRHLLLVDDVLTTGSTLVAAYEALQSTVSHFRVSFLTLALTAD